MDMQMNAPMLGPGHRRKVPHQSRKISDEVWAAYDAEVVRLYLIEKKSLEELKTHFREAYGFDATSVSTFSSRYRV
jgi:hypothetical protein